MSWAEREQPVGEGRTAELHRRPDGTVVKLLRGVGDGPAADREAAALRALSGLGLAPRLLDRVEVDGRPGLVMEHLDGEPMAAILWRRPGLAARGGEAFAGLQLRIHDVEAPAVLPGLREELRRRIESAARLPADLAHRALQLLARLPDGDRLCHGDLHPYNVLVGWDDPRAIDWADATRGDPTGDVARTLLLAGLAKPPPGTGRARRALLRVARRAFVRSYLDTYRSSRPLDGPRLRRWELAWAAARFAEGVDEDEPELTEMLRVGLAGA